jgi:hypothetical protein
MHTFYVYKGPRVTAKAMIEESVNVMVCLFIAGGNKIFSGKFYMTELPERGGP